MRYLNSTRHSNLILQLKLRSSEKLSKAAIRNIKYPISCYLSMMCNTRKNTLDSNWGQFHQRAYKQLSRAHILCCSTSISPTISAHKFCQLVCKIIDIFALNFCALCHTPKKWHKSTGAKSAINIDGEIDPWKKTITVFCASSECD